MRVAPEVEIEGLDLPEMGALAYPDFSLVPSHSVGFGAPTGPRIPRPGAVAEPNFVKAKAPLA
jgi:hypothetical protein